MPNWVETRGGRAVNDGGRASAAVAVAENEVNCASQPRAGATDRAGGHGAAGWHGVAVDQQAIAEALARPLDKLGQGLMIGPVVPVDTAQRLIEA